MCLGDGAMMWKAWIASSLLSTMVFVLACAAVACATGRTGFHHPYRMLSAVPLDRIDRLWRHVWALAGVYDWKPGLLLPSTRPCRSTTSAPKRYTGHGYLVIGENGYCQRVWPDPDLAPEYERRFVGGMPDSLVGVHRPCVELTLILAATIVAIACSAVLFRMLRWMFRSVRRREVLGASRRRWKWRMAAFGITMAVGYVVTLSLWGHPLWSPQVQGLAERLLTFAGLSNWFASALGVRQAIALGICMSPWYFAAILIWRWPRKAIDDDTSPHCSVCGYSLRALPTDTCPECGHRSAQSGPVDSVGLPKG